MVTDAMALAVPDTVGAANGTNPYHLWPDACKYSIGSGLFQGSGANAAKLVNTHYSTIGVPPWATALQIDATLGLQYLLQEL